jgi:hypothetical protein
MLKPLEFIDLLTDSEKIKILLKMNENYAYGHLEDLTEPELLEYLNLIVKCEAEINSF